MSRNRSWKAGFRVCNGTTSDRIREQVRDKLSRVNIYFVKEDHSHEMYHGTWDNPLVMSEVHLLLEQIMDVLTIDPNAKSY